MSEVSGAEHSVPWRSASDSDKCGSGGVFTGLAGVAALGLVMIWLVMPETRRVDARVR